MSEDDAMSGADAAWVTVAMPMPLPELRDFCRDVERLLRINPMLEFRNLGREGANTLRATVRNLSNGREDALEMQCERESEDVFVLRYREGIKAHTRFCMQASGSGSQLTIVDDYGRLPEEQRLARIAEVDHSLRAWGEALTEYAKHERRFGWLPLWGWYRRRVWLRMTPRARRITFVLLVVTFAEAAFAALVLAVYWAEQQGGT